MWNRSLSPPAKSPAARGRGDVSSTLPPPQDDPLARTQAILAEVQLRRNSGESLPDDQVLAEYPEFAELLRPELERLSGPQPSAIDGSPAIDAVPQQLDGPPAPRATSPNPWPVPLFAPNVSAVAAAAAQPAPLASVANEDTVPEPAAIPAEPAEQASAGRVKLSREVSPPGEVSPSPVVPSDYRETLVSAEEAAYSSEAPYTPIYCPSVRPPMGVLRLFHDGEPTFTSYPVMNDRFVIGRKEGDLIIPHDVWMSGRHVEVQRRRVQNGYRWFLVDLSSTNGTFVRSEVIVLRHKDELFIGRERYRFVSDGATAGLLHVTKGTANAEWIFQNAVERIGRQPPCGLPSFAGDPYLEPVHAELTRGVDGTWTLRDKRSRNGVWHRIVETELFADGMFQIGEQRIGFWCPSNG